ncbi:phosphopantetheine-binding protein [Micromonospora sp. CA-246542]|uniref:phosphopantetheine-binding protein n=1 Tax=Micromonospora sp. CA-246542 TaxID=3239959 RepID=UPI003D8A5177
MSIDAAIVDLWREFLGSEANLNSSFIANGGDSLKAVLLTIKLLEATRVEVDYLTVLQAQSAEDLRTRVTA